jgi:hypothetical protein
MAEFIEVQESQSAFLARGGIAAIALATMRKDGILPKSYTFQEYPKMVRLSEGVQSVKRSATTVDKERITWTDEAEMFSDIIVHSEDEEERVLSGGKTSAQIEEDRQALIIKCRAHGIMVDTSWTAVRLRRELGEKMDAPEPVDELSKLQARVAELEALDQARARIAELERRLAMPAEASPKDVIIGQLQALGVEFDRRWSVARLQDELIRAEAEERAA